MPRDAIGIGVTAWKTRFPVAAVAHRTVRILAALRLDTGLVAAPLAALTLGVRCTTAPATTGHLVATLTRYAIIIVGTAVEALIAIAALTDRAVRIHAAGSTKAGSDDDIRIIEPILPVSSIVAIQNALAVFDIAAVWIIGGTARARGQGR